MCNRLKLTSKTLDMFFLFLINGETAQIYKFMSKDISDGYRISKW